MKLTRLLTCALLVLGAGMFAPPAPALVALPPTPRPRPLPPPGWTYLWIAPVYRTVTDRNWVPETVQMVPQWIEISPGRLEQVWRQIITPGHWEITTRQVLIAEGHWELVRVDPPPPPYPPVFPPPPVIVRNPGTVGVDGYGSGPVEDLSKFSPLTEWPK